MLNDLNLHLRQQLNIINKNRNIFEVLLISNVDFVKY